MTLMTQPWTSPRPPSPWPGSQHHEQHRWQLDEAPDLPAVAAAVLELADQLSAAHAAGWWLSEPMRGGHLHAARLSRRQRAESSTGAPRRAAAGESVPPQPAEGRWRLRVVNEAANAGEDVFAPAAAPATPVLALEALQALGAQDAGDDVQAVHGLTQVAGPPLQDAVLTEMARQLGAAGAVDPGLRWGVSPARVGLGFDLVAEGSALRSHTVRAGVLARTREALVFAHAADDAADLAQAAAAYRRLAAEVEAVIAAGGRLLSADEGMVLVDYPSSRFGGAGEQPG